MTGDECLQGFSSAVVLAGSLVSRLGIEVARDQVRFVWPSSKSDCLVEFVQESVEGLPSCCRSRTIGGPVVAEHPDPTETQPSKAQTSAEVFGDPSCSRRERDCAPTIRARRPAGMVTGSPVLFAQNEQPDVPPTYDFREKLLGFPTPVEVYL